MHLKYRNVNDAFRHLVQVFADRNEAYPIVRETSRNGPVLRITEPVTITYSHPRERVLFNSARDANPFALLYEALWMLAGRNDLAPLTYYTKQFAEYSDDGQTLNGAYGCRWRCGTDQINVLVDHLKTDPTSRRAVLQMWNVEDDLLKIGLSKDVCCNLSVLFSLRFGSLDITVLNRSNDLIWGLLGANYVTFSVLQEYMAARLGAEIGVYHHVTNNLHVYDWNWKPAEWLASPTLTEYPFETVSLVRDPTTFEDELPRFVERFSGKLPAHELGADWAEPFLADVAAPLFIEWACHKEKDDHSAFTVLLDCEAEDWRTAAESWLRRRVKK